MEAEEGRTLFSSVPGPPAPEGEAYSTLETKFNLVRAITPDAGEVLAEGRVSPTAPPPA